MKNEARDHHYAPQFYLRNFAKDGERNMVHCVSKNGEYAVWGSRAIKGIGYEKDLYLCTMDGNPVSTETEINAAIETPISQSETWQKISSGRADLLDRSDKPILYSLIRHFELRTPHYLETMAQLAGMAGEEKKAASFTNEELEMYRVYREQPEMQRASFSLMSATLMWSANSIRASGLMIFRTPIDVFTSTTPVMAMPVPYHPKLHLPLPGMNPYQLVLPLNKRAIACLVLGDFDDGFTNHDISELEARGFNRHRVGHFAHFPQVKHLIMDRAEVVSEMTCAPYDVISDVPGKVTFRRKAAQAS
jgi:hypothetical protein